MGTICFGLAFRITYRCASKETWAFAASAPGRPKDPRVGKKFRSPTATLNDVRDESSIQVSSGGPGWLRLPYSYSRFHCSSQASFSTHISCRLRHFASLPLANLKGKMGGGERQVKKGFEKGGEHGGRRNRQVQEGSQVWQGGGIAGEHM